MSQVISVLIDPRNYTTSTIFHCPYIYLLYCDFPNSDLLTAICGQFVGDVNERITAQNPFPMNVITISFRPRSFIKKNCFLLGEISPVRVVIRKVFQLPACIQQKTSRSWHTKSHLFESSSISPHWGRTGTLERICRPQFFRLAICRVE